MISIIIVSINENLFKSIAKNISSTIGTEFEIIKIDNKIENLSLAAAYNKGAKMAKFEYLVFAHEDILFHTQNWDRNLIQILQDEKVGLVGVSGATYKSKYPVSWISVPEEFIRINAIQWYRNEPQKKYINPYNEKKSEVVIIDGLFMATTKKIFNYIGGFDELLIDGFHLYDLDFALRVKLINKKVIVTYDILIEHFSSGNLDINWFKKSIEWHNAKKNYLPVFIKPVSNDIINVIKKDSYKSIILSCLKTNYKLSLMIKSLISLILLSPKDKNNFNYIKFVVSFLLGIPKIKKYVKKLSKN